MTAHRCLPIVRPQPDTESKTERLADLGWVGRVRWREHRWRSIVTRSEGSASRCHPDSQTDSVRSPVPSHAELKRETEWNLITLWSKKCWKGPSGGWDRLTDIFEKHVARINKSKNEKGSTILWLCRRTLWWKPQGAGERFRNSFIPLRLTILYTLWNVSWEDVRAPVWCINFFLHSESGSWWVGWEGGREGGRERDPSGEKADSVIGWVVGQVTDWAVGWLGNWLVCWVIDWSVWTCVNSFGNCLFRWNWWIGMVLYKLVGGLFWCIGWWVVLVHWLMFG